MSDETRRLSPELEALLAAERAAAPPPEEARARVRGRLELSLGLILTPSVPLPPPAEPSAPPATGLSGTGKVAALGGQASAGLVKLSLAVVAAGTLAVGGYVGWRGRAPRAPGAVASSQPVAPVDGPPVAPPPSGAPAVAAEASSSSPKGSAVAAEASGERVLATPGPSRHRSPARVAHPAAAVPPPSAPATTATSPSARSTDRQAPSAAASAESSAARRGDLAAERALLSAARAALARGDATAALAIVARHAQQFPDGQLLEERASLRVRALAAHGDRAAARAAAFEFERNHPESLFLPTVRGAVDDENR